MLTLTDTFDFPPTSARVSGAGGGRGWEGEGVGGRNAAAINLTDLPCEPRVLGVAAALYIIIY